MDDLAKFQRGELIYLCQCEDSQPIHHSCIDLLIKKNTTLRSEDYCLYFKFDNLLCPHCNRDYPRSYRIGEQKYQLIKFDRLNDAPYIILEKLGQYKDGVFEGFIARFRGENASTLIIVIYLANL